MTQNDFIAEVERGKSKLELMEIFNISERTVRRKCKLYGIPNVKGMDARKISKTCLECGTQLNGNQTMYCSVKCKSRSFHNSHPENKDWLGKVRSEGEELKLLYLKDSGGCKCCGYFNNITALNFHHIVPTAKSFPLTIRNFGRKSTSKILEELSKCEVYCSNCHMELESPNLNKNDAKVKYFSSATGLRRKVLLLNEVGAFCRKCNYDKNYRALHFHHRNPLERSFGLNICECQSKPIEELRLEMLKCDVLCGNCHMEEHYPHLNIVLPR